MKNLFVKLTPMRRCRERIIREGDSIGCFYIESPGMRSRLKKMKSDTFEMLTAISSIIRPEVAESAMSEGSSGMAEFVARHHNPSKRKYLVPELEHVLGETFVTAKKTISETRSFLAEKGPDNFLKRNLYI